jgi:hypothetical protein
MSQSPGEGEVRNNFSGPGRGFDSPRSKRRSFFEGGVYSVALLSVDQLLLAQLVVLNLRAASPIKDCLEADVDGECLSHTSANQFA